MGEKKIIREEQNEKKNKIDLNRYSVKKTVSLNN